MIKQSSIRTTPFGLYKKNPPRKETITRLTKTLIITDMGRYDRETGLPKDLTNKRVGGFRIDQLTLDKYRV